MDVFWEASQELYEAMLVAAGVVSTITIWKGWTKFGRPWWEAKVMREAQEKEENAQLAYYMWWAARSCVQDGKCSVEHAATVVRRIANVLPGILPGREYGNKSLKELLQDKHLTVEVIATKTEPVKMSLLARLSADKRYIAPV